jgi:hypothetical protein
MTTFQTFIESARALIRQLGSRRISAHEIRREAFALGGRHLGEVLAGARQEVSAPGLSVQRIQLLRAVIRRETLAAKAL